MLGLGLSIQEVAIRASWRSAAVAPLGYEVLRGKTESGPVGLTGAGSDGLRITLAAKVS